MPLIDRFLSDYQFVERHAVLIAATSQRVAQLVVSRDMLAEDWIVRVMTALRASLSSLWQMLRPTSRPTIASFIRHSFTSLGYNEQEIVSGLVRRFWRPDGGLREISDAEDYLTFSEKGTPKLARIFLFLAQAAAPDS